jgi:phosphoribosylglycinamide formyltransferase 1
LNHGATRTGVTIHLVTPDLEVGPIVVQQPLEIRDGEIWHTLVERIHQLEVRLLPSALVALVEGRSLV